jgi:hypothetical protein
MADEKSAKQLNDLQLDEVGGGESIYTSYTATNFIHNSDSGKIRIKATVYPVSLGGGGRQSYECEKCGETWSYSDSVISDNFIKCF